MYHNVANHEHKHTLLTKFVEKSTRSLHRIPTQCRKENGQSKTNNK